MVPTPEMGVHGLIENGNRYLGALVGLVSVLAIVVAWRQRPRRRRPLRLALLTLAAVAGQGVLGGITVLTGLNPWTVGAHFLVSIGALAAAYHFWVSAREPDGEFVPVVPRPARALGILVMLASLAVITVGVVLTGSGPHAGDPKAGRNGLDPETLTRLHADLVFLLLGLTVGLWLAARALEARAAARAALVLTVIELAQGVVGIVQYLLDVPEVLVGLHMAGACAVWLATLAAWTRLRSVLPPVDSAQARRDGLGETPGRTLAEAEKH
jgi:cytochrome c oxidase assembly protein subunit 15